jgi:phosphoadenosine phosphosulfate reductase
MASPPGYQAETFQSSTRAELDLFEIDEGRVKVNPLADWSAGEILDYAKDQDLPPHPLVAQGYPSIGLPAKVHGQGQAGRGPARGTLAGTGQDRNAAFTSRPTHGREIDGSGI